MKRPPRFRPFRPLRRQIRMPVWADTGLRLAAAFGLVFLVVMIRYLARCSLLRAVLLSVMIVALIYLVFRLVFTVLMPAGIVPEAEIIAWVKGLFAGGGN